MQGSKQKQFTHGDQIAPIRVKLSFETLKDLQQLHLNVPPPQLNPSNQEDHFCKTREAQGNILPLPNWYILIFTFQYNYIL